MPFGWLKDKIKDLGEEAWEVVEDVADAVVDTAGGVATSVDDVIGTVGAVIDTVTFGAASGVMHAVDNTVLDGLDAVTGGLVDVDFDDGNFSASVGVDGIVHVGAKVGEDGLQHSSHVLDQGFDVGVSDKGLDASGQAGIDWGPLPYAGGSVQIDGDGNIAAEGKVQGTVPTPIGLLSGQAEAAVMRQGDTWAGEVHADGTLTLPSGSVIGGGVDVAYLETPEGSALDLGLEGSFTVPGTGTVGGSVGYQRVESGGVVAEKFEAGAYAEGYGGRVEVGVNGERVTTANGSVSEWDASGDVSLPAIGSLGGGGGQSADASAEASAPEVEAQQFDEAIAAADEVEVSVDEMFSDIG